MDELQLSALNSNYKYPGVTLFLPEDFEQQTMSDWRAVHFSIILPLPKGITVKVYPSDLALNDYSNYPKDLPKEWIAGRFFGLKKIEKPRLSGDGTYKRPVWSAEDREFYDFTPRATYNGAKERFGYPFVDSIERTSGESQSGGSTTVRTMKKVYTFDYTVEHDLDAPDSKGLQGKINELADTQRKAFQKSGWRVRLESSANGNASGGRQLGEHATVGLAAAEYIHFDPVSFHPVDSSKENVVGTDFLVLHVIAEHCSSAQLDAISRSLHRPRNKVRLANTEYPESLLAMFCTQALKDLKIDEEVKLSRGGYIERQWSDSTDTESGTPSYGQTKVFRNVCAIPGKEITEFPRLLKGIEVSTSWSPYDAWAWLLSTGADRYYAGIPQLDDATLQESRFTDQKYWTFHTTGQGMAVVRKAEATKDDPSPWSLTGTRFVDLAILVLRAGSYLATMSGQLRALKMNFDRLEESIKDGSLKDDTKNEALEKAKEQLSATLKNLNGIQRDHVFFRDHLWFEAVPGRELDSKVLKSIQQARGIERHYDDVKDELTLRENIYDSQYRYLRMELDQQLAQIQADNEAAAREREKNESRQRERLNFFVAVAALVLAIPGLIALAPGAPSWAHLGIALMLIVPILMWLWHRNSKNLEADYQGP